MRATTQQEMRDRLRDIDKELPEAQKDLRARKLWRPSCATTMTRPASHAPGTRTKRRSSGAKP